MKTLITIMLSFFGFAVMAQSDLAISEGAKALSASKTSGDYTFVMPDNVTSKDIETNSKYYELYFKPRFDESTHKVSLALRENNERNRYVVARFLTACGVQQVKIDDQTVDMTTFIERYLK